MIRKALMVLGVLLGGLDYSRTVTAPDGMQVQTSSGTFQSMAMIVYAICLLVVLFRTVDEMPGVFALKQPLGPVRSGYEFLWLPIALATFVGLEWSNSYEVEAGLARIQIRYGYVSGELPGTLAPLMAALLMLALKFKAAMRTANGRLFGAPRS